MTAKRPPILEPLLTTEQAADTLGLEPETLASWRCASRDKGLPYVKLGKGRVRYRPSDVRAFIEQKLQAA